MPATEVAVRLSVFEQNRDRVRIEEAFRTYAASLETLRMNVGPKEDAILAQERVVVMEELAAMLAKI